MTTRIYAFWAASVKSEITGWLERRVGVTHTIPVNSFGNNRCIFHQQSRSGWLLWHHRQPNGGWKTAWLTTSAFYALLWFSNSTSVVWYKANVLNHSLCNVRHHGLTKASL